MNSASTKGWFYSKSTLNQICFGFETVSTDDTEAKFQVSAFSIDTKSKPALELPAPASNPTNPAPANSGDPCSAQQKK
jgi:hypothetical protein